MKEMTNIIIGIMMVCLFAGTTMAVDINALDQVSVLMTKSKVLSLLGMPDAVGKAGNGLEMDIYRVNDMGPMIGRAAYMKTISVLLGRPLFFREK